LSKEDKKKKIEPIVTRGLGDVIKKAVDENKDFRDMKILWHSVAPYVSSGYGKVTKYTVGHLMNRGIPMFVSCFYGIQEGGVMNYNGIYMLPVRHSSFDKLGILTVLEHYKRLKCDLAVWHTDFWPSYKFAELIPNALLYSPIDHDSYAEKWLKIFKSYKWIAVPSKHGVGVLNKAKIPSTYVPHGVDIKVYKPLPRDLCRKMYTLKPENYVIGIVAANQDEEPRKGWDTMFQSLKIFADNNPDVQKNLVIFLHTDPKNEKGRNLVELSHEIGIDKYIIWNDAYISSIVGLPENALAKLYNTFDVFLMLSRREGFCLPVLEAQACGVPCIVNDFSALNERVDNGRVGWLCKPAAKVYSNLNGITSIPDAYKGADALTEAYNSPSKREAFAKKGIEYAKTQTWEIAVDKYWMPFLRKIWDDIQENRKKAVETKKIEDEKAWKEKAKETTKEEQKPTS